MSRKRNYSYSDVDMLMTSKTIALSFKTNIDELATVRTDFSAEYADALITRIDAAMESHLGIDVKKELREATNALRAIQTPALQDLSFFKTQVVDDFKDQTQLQEEILKSLGYNTHLREAQKGSQESLLALLYAFKQNMSTDLKEQITARGMAPALIDRITGYADGLRQANAIQEHSKETSKEVTLDIRNTFNAIYDEIIGICKKASSYYQFESTKKEQFTFSKVASNLGAARRVQEVAS